MKTTPFSYYLYHRPTNQHYYGIRHCRGCQPSELWVKYFSSSLLVKKLIEQYGSDSFEWQIRKTFTDSESALLWEHRFLKRINAAGRSDWLNRHNGGNKFRGPKSHTNKTRQKISNKTKGIRKSDATKSKISAGSLLDRQRRRDQGWKMPEDFAQRMLQTRKGKIEKGIINPYSEERNAKMRESKRGAKRHYLPDGSFIMIKSQVDQ
jgi:hypothetical protein